MKKKTLGNTTASGARKNVKDIVFWGNGDSFRLISKASSKAEGWMKSTKAMQVGTSVVIQVTTQQMNPDGSYAVAEALTTLHDVMIMEHTNENQEIVARSIESIAIPILSSSYEISLQAKGNPNK